MLGSSFTFKCSISELYISNVSLSSLLCCAFFFFSHDISQSLLIYHVYPLIMLGSFYFTFKCFIFELYISNVSLSSLLCCAFFFSHDISQSLLIYHVYPLIMLGSFFFFFTFKCFIMSYTFQMFHFRVVTFFFSTTFLNHC